MDYANGEGLSTVSPASGPLKTRSIDESQSCSTRWMLENSCVIFRVQIIFT